MIHALCYWDHTILHHLLALLWIFFYGFGLVTKLVV